MRGKPWFGWKASAHYISVNEAANAGTLPASLDSPDTLPPKKPWNANTVNNARTTLNSS